MEAKIQKLQELLEKCKDRLSANNEKIHNLTKENDSLKTILKEQNEVIKM